MINLMEEIFNITNIYIYKYVVYFFQFSILLPYKSTFGCNDI